MKVLAGLLLAVSLSLGTMVFAAETATEKKETPAVEVKAEKAVDPNAMVVKINDQVVKEKDVAAEAAKRLAAQTKRMPPGMEINDWMRNQVRTSVVDMLVEKALLEQTLASKKIAVTDEQVMTEIAEVAKQQNIKMEDVPEEIAKFGMTDRKSVV